MREKVTIEFAGQEFGLAPTFGALDLFEDRHGSIALHYQKLGDLSATMTARAYLVWQALKAGDPSLPFTLEATRVAMFDAGLWHESVVTKEIELVEKLLYTPEQYIEKKNQLAAASKAQEDALASLDGLSNFSA